MGHPTLVRDQPGIASRAVPLASHPAASRAEIVVGRSRGHVTVRFEGYWHNTHIAMSHAELEQFRDAINAVLAAEIPAEDDGELLAA